MITETPAIYWNDATGVKSKFWAPIISSVGNLQLFVGILSEICSVWICNVCQKNCNFLSPCLTNYGAAYSPLEHQQH